MKEKSITIHDSINHRNTLLKRCKREGLDFKKEVKFYYSRSYYA